MKKIITSKMNGRCYETKKPFGKGDSILWIDNPNIYRKGETYCEKSAHYQTYLKMITKTT